MALYLGNEKISDVNVKFVSATTTQLQSKEVSPSESQIEVTPDSGYDGLSSVTIDAIDSNYVGSGITRRGSADLTVGSSGVITAAGGYYPSNTTKQLTTKAATTITPTTSAQTAVAANTYTTGAVTVAAIQTEEKTATSNGTVTPSSGKYLTKVTVNVPSSINNQNKTVTPSENQQSVTADSGYSGLGTVTVNAIDSEYVGSDVPRKTSSDLELDVFNHNATITTPSGYYSQDASYTIEAAEHGDLAVSYSARGGNFSVTMPIVTAGYEDSNIYQGFNPSDITGDINIINSDITITPSESQQVAADYGTFTTAGQILVDAIPSNYIGSGITQRSSSDLTASGATVTVPTGYYAGAASKSVASGSAKGPTSLSGSSATVSTGTNTITLTKTGVTTTPTVSAGYVSGATASTATVALTASVTTKAATTITPGTTNQTIASGTYLTGTQTISGDADLVTGNIKSGVSIFGVTGSYSGLDTSDATATAADIVNGETAYVNGSKITGSLVIQHYYTGTSAPSSSLGVNGDIYLQS